MNESPRPNPTEGSAHASELNSVRIKFALEAFHRTFESLRLYGAEHNATQRVAAEAANAMNLAVASDGAIVMVGADGLSPIEAVLETVSENDESQTELAARVLPLEGLTKALRLMGVVSWAWSKPIDEARIVGLADWLLHASAQTQPAEAEAVSGGVVRLSRLSADRLCLVAAGAKSSDESVSAIELLRDVLMNRSQAGPAEKTIGEAIDRLNDHRDPSEIARELHAILDGDTSSNAVEPARIDDERPELSTQSTVSPEDTPVSPDPKFSEEHTADAKMVRDVLPHLDPSILARVTRLALASGQNSEPPVWMQEIVGDEEVRSTIAALSEGLTIADAQTRPVGVTLMQTLAWIAQDEGVDDSDRAESWIGGMIGVNGDPSDVIRNLVRGLDSSAFVEDSYQQQLDRVAQGNVNDEIGSMMLPSMQWDEQDTAVHRSGVVLSCLVRESEYDGELDSIIPPLSAAVFQSVLVQMMDRSEWTRLAEMANAVAPVDGLPAVTSSVTTDSHAAFRRAFESAAVLRRMALCGLENQGPSSADLRPIIKVLGAGLISVLPKIVDDQTAENPSSVSNDSTRGESLFQWWAARILSESVDQPEVLVALIDLLERHPQLVSATVSALVHGPNSEASKVIGTLLTISVERMAVRRLVEGVIRGPLKLDSEAMSIMLDHEEPWVFRLGVDSLVRQRDEAGLIEVLDRHAKSRHGSSVRKSLAADSALARLPMTATIDAARRRFRFSRGWWLGLLQDWRRSEVAA